MEARATAEGGTRTDTANCVSSSNSELLSVGSVEQLLRRRRRCTVHTAVDIRSISSLAAAPRAAAQAFLPTLTLPRVGPRSRCRRHRYPDEIDPSSRRRLHRSRFMAAAAANANVPTANERCPVASSTVIVISLIGQCFSKLRLQTRALRN